MRKNKMGTWLKIAIIFSVLMTLTFVGSLICILVTKSLVGHIILLISGLIELAVAGIVAFFENTIENYTCPECGTTRKREREYLRTEETVSDTSTTRNSVIKYKYKHFYLDTYTCPNCGTEKNVHTSGYGGELLILNGQTFDKRISPREF